MGLQASLGSILAHTSAILLMYIYIVLASFDLYSHSFGWRTLGEPTLSTYLAICRLSRGTWQYWLVSGQMRCAGIKFLFARLQFVQSLEYEGDSCKNMRSKLNSWASLATAS